MTLDVASIPANAVPARDILSGAWAVLRWLGGALVWLLDHGLLVALATAVAAWIAWQAHQREKRRAEENRRANDARIEALAYALRQELTFWDLNNSGVTDQEKAKNALEAVDPLEERAKELMVLAADASADQQKQVYEATTALYRTIFYLRCIRRGRWYLENYVFDRDVPSDKEIAVLKELGDAMQRNIDNSEMMWRNARQSKQKANDHLYEAAGGLKNIGVVRMRTNSPNEV